MSAFEKALERKVLVCDGAMGTMLYAQGAFVNRSFDELNVIQPDLVAGVHRAYAEAGVDVVETNTFGANRVNLESFGLVDQLSALNAAGKSGRIRLLRRNITILCQCSRKSFASAKGNASGHFKTSPNG